jgi:transposase
VDESGLLLAPLRRRTWARVGQTPVLLQRAKQRDKVSVGAALWLTPGQSRLGLSYRTLVNGYFNNERVAAWLADLLGEWRSPAIVVWDGGNMHKGDPIAAVVGGARGRLLLERLPPYGAELMPLEWLWSWLKHTRLGNFAPHDAQQLNDRAVAELGDLQQDQQRLAGFFHAAALALPRTLLL